MPEFLASLWDKAAILRSGESFAVDSLTCKKMSDVRAQGNKRTNSRLVYIPIMRTLLPNPSQDKIVGGSVIVVGKTLDFALVHSFLENMTE
jgi:hypothetical protein